jgi:hypothetical protein
MSGGANAVDRTGQWLRSKATYTLKPPRGGDPRRAVRVWRRSTSLTATSVVQGPQVSVADVPQRPPFLREFESIIGSRDPFAIRGSDAEPSAMEMRCRF